MRRKLLPNTRSTPVRTRWVPQTSNEIAARRFNKCVMSGVDYTLRTQRALKRPEAVNGFF